LDQYKADAPTHDDQTLIVLKVTAPRPIEPRP
jgi:hypothetical protein